MHCELLLCRRLILVRMSYQVDIDAVHRAAHSCAWAKKISITHHSRLQYVGPATMSRIREQDLAAREKNGQAREGLVDVVLVDARLASSQRNITRSPLALCLVFVVSVAETSSGRPAT